MRTPLLFLVVAVASDLPAQVVHLVGPGGYPQIHDAIIAAAPGDIVDVQPGTYAGFGTTKGVTIRAVGQGTVSIAGGWLSVLSAPAGETVHMVGFHIGTVYVTGNATFDGCTFVNPTGLQVQGASVQMQDCVLTPPSTGAFFVNAVVLATDSDVSAVDCRIEGTDAMGLGPPEPAVLLVNSTFRGCNLTLRGGSGSPTRSAIEADASSRVWLSDSTVTGDPASCPIAASQGRHDRCTITPNCSGIPAGFVLGVRRLGPPQNGVPMIVELRALPNTPIAIFAALSLEPTLWPQFEQPLLLPVATAYAFDFAVTDPTGFGLWAMTVPAGPAAVGRSFWLQAFSGPTWPMQASPAFGGVIR